MKTIKYFLNIIIALIFTCSSTIEYAYSQKAIVGPEKLISETIDYPLIEPHFIIDPNDDNHFLVAAMAAEKYFERGDTQSHIVLFQSWDTGKTWDIKHFNNYEVNLAADPWLSMNNRGTVLLSSINRIDGARFIDMLVFISNDSGKTWKRNPLNLGHSYDRQSIVVDPETQHFIMASAQFNYNSENEYKDGMMITRFQRDGSLLTNNWHDFGNVNINNGPPVISPKGELLIPVVDYVANAKMLETKRNWLLKSDDLGKTFSHPILMSEGGRFPNILLDLYSDTTKIHFLKPLGALREYEGFEIITSNDGGYTWEEPVDVDQYDENEPYMQNAVWEINNKGQIIVCWYDRRANSGTELHDLFFAYSTDQGKTFSKPQKITLVSSKANPEKNGHVDVRWPTGGDYFGLDSDNNGVFHVIWPDHRNGYSQLFYSTVEIGK